MSTSLDFTCHVCGMKLGTVETTDPHFIIVVLCRCGNRMISRNGMPTSAKSLLDETGDAAEDYRRATEAIRFVENSEKLNFGLQVRARRIINSSVYRQRQAAELDVALAKRNREREDRLVADKAIKNKKVDPAMLLQAALKNMSQEDVAALLAKALGGK